MKKNPQMALMLQKVHTFFAGKRALIVDESVGVRASIFNVLKELGCNPLDIQMATTAEEANALILKKLPSIIVTDYALNSGTGIDLFKLRNDRLPGIEGTLSVLITQNARESSIAEAIDEEVDCYILKPFTISTFKNYMMSVALSKETKTGYNYFITKGKTAFLNENLTEARTYFNEALKASTAPSLAHFYLGQIELKVRNLTEAEIQFNKGLSFNSQHYRCLMGLFDLYVEQKKHKEAYQTSKKILGQFPFSPQKLEIVIRLVVINKAFEDLDFLYNYYLQMDNRPTPVIKGMIAAMVVAVSYYLDNHHTEYSPEKAFEWGKRAVVSSGRAMWVFREVALSLIRAKCTHEAERFLRESTPEQKATPDYQALDYFIFNFSGTPAQLVEKGRKLIASGIQDPIVYDILAKRSEEMGYSDAADDLRVEQRKRWPEHANVMH